MRILRCGSESHGPESHGPESHGPESHGPESHRTLLIFRLRENQNKKNQE